MTENLDQQPLITHLIELRKRLIYCLIGFFIAFGISYYFAGDIFAILVHPLAKIFGPESGRRLIYTGLTEAFMTYIKVAMFSAAFISFPLIAIQIWKFVAPGLYTNEKRTFFPFLFATPVLFITGAAFAYFFIIPNAWKFFVSFETPAFEGGLPIQLEARVNEYLSITIQLLLAFGCSFLLPIALVLLARVGLISVSSLKNKRKYAFLIILIVSAFITPPDVISMVGLAIPLYLLYEISIFFATRLNKIKDDKEISGV